MAIKTSAGTKFFIGTTASASTLTEYRADVYEAVGEIESFGAFGDTAEEIKFTSLSDSRVQKVAGVRDAGEVELVMGYDPDDAGQSDLIAAFDANNGAPFNFKVELNDALTSGAGPHHGTEFFWKGVVMSKEFEAGSNKDVVKLKVKVAITTAISEGAAA